MGLDQYVYRISKIQEQKTIYDKYFNKIITYEQFNKLYCTDNIYVFFDNKYLINELKPYVEEVVVKDYTVDGEHAFKDQFPSIKIKDDFAIVNTNYKDNDIIECTAINDNKRYPLQIDANKYKKEVILKYSVIYKEEASYWAGRLFLENWMYNNTIIKDKKDNNNQFNVFSKDIWLKLITDLTNLLYKQETEPFQDKENSINVDNLSLDFIRETFKELTQIVNNTNFDNQLLCYYEDF